MVTSFWNWLVKNLSNIFSFLGIVLTLYFGAIYVPSWIEANQNEKIKNAQIILEQSIKELIYSDSPAKYCEIESLAQAKEIELKQVYPISRASILTKVQESFMHDVFLPLNTRKKLIAELEILKSEIPKNLEPLTVDVPQSHISLLLSPNNLALVSVILSVLGVIVGLLSSYLKFKLEKAKQEEIDNQLVDTDDERWDYENSIEFEKAIIDTISKQDGVKIVRTSNDRDFGLDLEFTYNNKKYFVEVKYLSRNKVGLKSFQKFLAEMKRNEGEFWFIYNTDLTEMVRRKFQEAKKIETDRRKIKLINVDSPHTLGRQLKELLQSK